MYFFTASVCALTRRTPFRKGRFNFDSLRWKLSGREVPCPTNVQLCTMQEGDGVWLIHGVAEKQERPPRFILRRHPILPSLPGLRGQDRSDAPAGRWQSWRSLLTCRRTAGPPPPCSARRCVWGGVLSLTARARAGAATHARRAGP